MQKIEFSIQAWKIKWDSNLNNKYVYREVLYKSCILIQVLSKSVEKWRSCGRLNICKWTVMEAAILQPELICVNEIKDKAVGNLHYSFIKHFLCTTLHLF